MIVQFKIKRNPKVGSKNTLVKSFTHNECNCIKNTQFSFLRIY